MHAITMGREFPNINSMTLIKHIPHSGTIMNIWGNLNINIKQYKYKTQTPDKLIPEQI